MRHLPAAARRHANPLLLPQPLPRLCHLAFHRSPPPRLSTVLDLPSRYPPRHPNHPVPLRPGHNQPLTLPSRHKGGHPPASQGQARCRLLLAQIEISLLLLRLPGLLHLLRVHSRRSTLRSQRHDHQKSN